MIKKAEQIKMMELYECYYSVTTGNRFAFKWKSNVRTFHTCGNHAFEIECLDVIPESIEIAPLISDDSSKVVMNQTDFNRLHPEDQLDFRCNCHGFTFANGKYFITDSFVDYILDDEFYFSNEREIAENNFDVVVFKDKAGRIVHSCKYQYDLYIHKEGIRRFSVHTGIQAILQIEEYQETIPVYYKRRNKSCPGICLNAIGEPFIKAFGNN